MGRRVAILELISGGAFGQTRRKLTRRKTEARGIKVPIEAEGGHR